MRFRISLPAVALLVFTAALSTSSALAQSLSITRKAESNFWVEATSPAGTPYTLQASENLHLWVDLHDVQDQYSYEFQNAGVTERYFRLVPTPPPAPDIRVLLLGDSLTSDCCGWGGGIYGYFKPNATVVNYAQAWTSTKVFLQSAELDKMLLIKPNYVLIQYGFMDGSVDPDRSTTLPEFADNLRNIVQMVRGFNGVPILITVHAARLWDDQGNVVPAWQERNAVVKQIATELNTPLIDLYQLSFDLLTQLGPDGSAFMELWAGDFVHLSPLGAQYFARLVVNALPDELGPYLTGILEPPPEP